MESLTFNEKLEVPPAVGVPLIVAEELVEVNFKPAGSDPEAKDQVSPEAAPPWEVIEALYPMFTLAEGRDVVIIFSGASTVRLKLLVIELPSLEALIVKFEVPVPVGFPLSLPALGPVLVRVMPEGSDPEVMVHA